MVTERDGYFSVILSVTSGNCRVVFRRPDRSEAEWRDLVSTNTNSPYDFSVILNVTSRNQRSLLARSLADVGHGLDLDQDLGRGQRAHLDQGRGREVTLEELAARRPD